MTASSESRVASALLNGPHALANRTLAHRPHAVCGLRRARRVRRISLCDGPPVGAKAAVWRQRLAGPAAGGDAGPKIMKDRLGQV